MTLTDELRREVLTLEEDLRARVDVQDGVAERWQTEHRDALTAGRTASAWEPWRDDRVTQAAVAWVLLTVFARFGEDNALLAPVWISGPGLRHQEALDAQLAYFRTHPEHTDREWLGEAVRYLGELPATRDLFDERSPLRWVAPSGDAATALLEFWRERDENGVRPRDLAESARSTRFLGDVYEQLSEHAREVFALRQTPEFVADFILDRTMEPALKERPLDGFRLIDPACGCGHFLLGAFPRLLDRWQAAAPAMDTRVRVQKALDSLHGVDINPFAVAITRFRLTIAALTASGLASLEKAPDFAYHVAVGDSLLHGEQPTLDLGRECDIDAGAAGFAYSSEDLDQLRAILQPHHYDVVVGNPPYITVKDKALNKLYRSRYTYTEKRSKKSLCKGTYAMTVPFMVRFFELAKTNTNGPAGWVGQITANSFMKREFGAPLIEKFLATKDLTLIVDASWVHIPGHGTPPVIVMGRSQKPPTDRVRAVLGIRGQIPVPADSAKGFVWQSILDHWDKPGHSGDWTSTADLDRSMLATHPWSLTGGGAFELRQRVMQAGTRSLDTIATCGFRAITGADDVYVRPLRLFSREKPAVKYRPYVTGDGVRDFSFRSEYIVFPYPDNSEVEQLLWPWRTNLSDRRRFGIPIRDLEDTPWSSLREFYPNRFDESRPTLAFAFVATHNHFSYERDGRITSRHAPVVQYRGPATGSEPEFLLGLLSSSTGCFWLKQNSHDKGSQGVHEGVKAEAWERFFEFTGATVEAFPLPAGQAVDAAPTLDALAQELLIHTPAAVCEHTPTRADLDTARAQHDRIRAQMIALQEELDWEVYRLYGLITEQQAKDVTADGPPEPLALGERAFEIALARQVERGEEETAWFARHGSTPITELPAHWPPAYRATVQHRLDLIESEPSIRLLEKPEYKRRWSLDPWPKREQAALRDWLLDRLEDRRHWFDRHGRPTPRSVAQLADEVARDADLTGVLTLWEGRRDVPVTESLTRLLADQAVPYLAAYRYQDSGLRKRSAWERTWDLQRREDAGEQLDEPIPVPPRYAKADFFKNHYWQARGKLDVPKERFVAYPDAGRDTDVTPLLGWAGWDHVEQALALGLLLGEREQEGWDDERLVPLVAGLAELQPWVRQWHAELHPVYGVDMAEFCATQLAQRCQQVGRTLDELAAWRPTPARRGRKRSS